MLDLPLSYKQIKKQEKKKSNQFQFKITKQNPTDKLHTNKPKKKKRDKICNTSVTQTESTDWADSYPSFGHLEVSPCLSNTDSPTDFAAQRGATGTLTGSAHVNLPNTSKRTNPDSQALTAIRWWRFCRRYSIGARVKKVLDREERLKSKHVSPVEWKLASIQQVIHKQ